MSTYHQLSAISRLLASLRPVVQFQDPEPALRAPRIPIAEGNGGIRQADIRDPNVPIQVLITAYSGMRIADKIDLFWDGDLIDTQLVNESHIELGTMTLNVPTSVVKDGTPPVHFLTTSSIGDNVRKSHPLNILVKTNVPGGPDLDPSTPNVNERLALLTGVPNPVDESNANNIVATVPKYENMAQGDTITLSWGGYYLKHIVQPEEVNLGIAFPVSRAIIEQAGSGSVPVMYEVRDVVNNWSLWSLPVNTDVEVGDLLFPPSALDAVDGKIDLAQLGEQDARISVPVYRGRALNDLITLTWRGHPPIGDPIVHDQTHTVVADDGQPVLLTVPNSIAKASAAGTAALSYTVTSDRGKQPSRRTSVEIIGQVQRLAAPTLQEAVGDSVDLGKIPEGGASVVVAAYPGMASGDKVELFCAGTAADGRPSTYPETRDISGGMVGQPVPFTVPKVFFTSLLNGSLRIYYRVKGEESDELQLRVVGDGGALLPAPSVNGVVDGVLDPDDVPNGTNATVPQYTGKAVGDLITLIWQGRVPFTDFIDVTAANFSTPIDFRIAHTPYIIDNLNSDVAVNYRVQPKSGGPVSSAVLNVPIRHKTQDNFVAPTVVQAVGGKLDPYTALNGATVRVAYVGMLPTDTLAVTWTGNSDADTIVTEPKSGNTSGQVDFTIPVSVVAASQDKTITVRYGVVRQGKDPVPSEPLNLPVSALGQQHLRPPIVPETKGTETLDITTFPGNATVTVAAWPLIAAGQRYWIKASGTLKNDTPHSFYVARSQVVSAGEVGTGLNKPMLRTELENLKDSSSLTVEVRVAFDGGTNEGAARTFPLLSLTLRNSAVIKPTAPFVPKAPGGRLNVQEDMYYDDFLAVEVRQFEGMANGQSIVLEWDGPYFKWTSQPQIVSTPGLLTFQVPRLEVIDAIDQRLQVRYTINGTISSPNLSLGIESQGIQMPPPRYFDRGTRHEVSILSPDQQDGYTGRVRWNGVVVRDSDEQHLQRDRIEYFQIPEAWITENRGREVLINYTIYRGNNERFRFSRVLRQRF